MMFRTPLRHTNQHTKDPRMKNHLSACAPTINARRSRPSSAATHYSFMLAVGDDEKREKFIVTPAIKARLRDLCRIIATCAVSSHQARST